MPFNANVLQVLIASPGDIREERDAVESALHGWNSSRAQREQVILLPRRWESDSVPTMGGDGQEIINAQLVDKSDIVVALFDSKLGMATPRAVSGTAEEIERAMSAGKPVHIWFSDAPVSRDRLASAQEVDDFRKSLQSRGLLGTYSDPADLAFQVRQAVESDLDRLDLATPTGRVVAAGADPVASFSIENEQYHDTRGKLRNRTRNPRLTIENHGSAAAEDLAFELAPLDAGAVPRILEHEITPNIPAKGSYSWLVLRMMGSSSNLQMSMKWRENGEERTKVQSVSLV